MLEISLIIILIGVLVLPISISIVERNIEIFLFFMGILAMTFAHFLGNEPLWSVQLLIEALEEPLPITVTVLIAGILVMLLKKAITRHIWNIEKFLGHRLFVFFLITILGLLSSLITAIMAAILLVEIVNVLKYKREFEIKLVILGCFAIGLGAVLTPVGEPLSTICVAKLRGEPYNAGFFFLLKNLGFYVVPGVLLCALLGSVIKVDGKSRYEERLHENEAESFLDVFKRTGKVYVFVMALIFLGTGFKPLIDKYIIELPRLVIYWINILSAIMDNATLAAAEISPRMVLPQIRSALLGLLIAGGMLIPGNIPNIISAGRLGIRSKEWARFGIPLGLVMMAAYFVLLNFIR